MIVPAIIYLDIDIDAYAKANQIDEEEAFDTVIDKDFLSTLVYDYVSNTNLPDYVRDVGSTSSPLSEEA
jgi:hypothetical protein